MHTAENETSRSQHAVNKSASGSALFFQPKLAINQPNDAYEQEADVMADKVMRVKDNENASQSFSNLLLLLFNASVHIVKKRKDNSYSERK